MSVPDILNRRHDFLERVKERIRDYPCNFTEAWENLTSSPDKKEHRIAAGVLVPLFFDDPSLGEDATEKSFSLLMIKRSNKVAQPGDLSFPGGMLSKKDRFLSTLFRYLPFFHPREEIFNILNKNNISNSRLIELFVATSLRESWEEIGLSPFRTQIIGPLPTYNLMQFKRTIFPIVGFIDRFGPLSTNGEVEKLVRIPLASFYNEENLGSIMIEKSTERTAHAVEFPCLIHRENDGTSDILWGATFNITLEFLKIALDYRLPTTRKGGIISRTLTPAYLSDRPHR